MNCDPKGIFSLLVYVRMYFSLEAILLVIFLASALKGHLIHFAPLKLYDIIWENVL